MEPRYGDPGSGGGVKLGKSLTRRRVVDIIVIDQSPLLLRDPSGLPVSICRPLNPSCPGLCPPALSRAQRESGHQDPPSHFSASRNERPSPPPLPAPRSPPPASNARVFPNLREPATPLEKVGPIDARFEKAVKAAVEKYVDCPKEGDWKQVQLYSAPLKFKRRHPRFLATSLERRRHERMDRPTGRRCADNRLPSPGRSAEPVVVRRHR
ncbi:hypothetical protein BDK51DRAFT_49683 [Blyttiomyces helicus]|uniref:Uncharacterized protein n=1 Tax=Blyttiomyces helicus TaxID=388810 RepID=A0A4P9VVT1_9FUNG|nr:hypothetical protein BDK51DRAFT_49683 [Blyttiomyces helicus]|eukprot:RKO83781.1 hypothetical protein BDK51DRAFT_49683 [Blyttiomyces helicus]